MNSSRTACVLLLISKLATPTTSSLLTYCLQCFVFSLVLVKALQTQHRECPHSLSAHPLGLFAESECSRSLNTGNEDGPIY